MSVDSDIKDMNGFCLNKFREFFSGELLEAERMAGVSASIMSKLIAMPTENFNRLLESNTPVFTLRFGNSHEVWKEKFAAIKR